MKSVSRQEAGVHSYSPFFNSHSILNKGCLDFCVFVSNFYSSGRSYFSPLVVGAICPATSTDGHKCFGSGKTIVISNLPGK